MEETTLKLQRATTEQVRQVWVKCWGVPVITVKAAYRPPDVEGLALVTPAGELAAMVTWAVYGQEAELVTLDALEQRRGHGSRLIEAAEEALRERGVRRLFLITTNDNPEAAGLYARRGFRLIRLHLDAMDRVRAQKPSVPETGEHGIPLRDVWEMERWLMSEKNQARAQSQGSRVNVSSGSPFEPTIGFSRAVRVGDVVAVSGTAPLDEQGQTVGAGDVHAQTRRCIEVARQALEQAGADLSHVVRTRVLLSAEGMERWQEAARAHGEAFSEVRPACTFVQVAGFIDEQWLVELELDAVVPG